MPRSSPAFDSVRSLAAAVGKSHVAVGKWVRDDRWTFGPGPWSRAQLPNILAWAATNLAPDNSAPDTSSPAAGTNLQAMPPEKRAKLALAVEKVETSKLNREIKLGKYHRVDECEQRRLRQIHTVRTELLNLAESLPFEPAQKQIVRDRCHALCERFSAGR